ncbi:hypothetical protein V9K67_10230 [Paraflavisolibacter sp. H34]|uniref:hypothetical protein n=1 Tax=Huijunlia imazamoxiresistens TaxID=3127457 RepID=UPI0030190EFE
MSFMGFDRGNPLGKMVKKGRKYVAIINYKWLLVWLLTEELEKMGHAGPIFYTFIFPRLLPLLKFFPSKR